MERGRDVRQKYEGLLIDWCRLPKVFTVPAESICSPANGSFRSTCSLGIDHFDSNRSTRRKHIRLCKDQIIQKVVKALRS